MILPSYIIYAILLLWLIYAIQRIFFCVYFWQLKEYRFDRIKGDIKKSLKVFFPKTAVISFIVLLSLLFFLIYKNASYWDNLVAAVFCLFGIYSIFLLSKKRWKLPKFTPKAVLLSFLSIIFLIYCLIIFISKFFMFAVLAELVLASATFLIAEILQIPTFFVKKTIYKKAKNKIEQQKGLTVIGITGSYGKSSTKEFLSVILSKKYKVLKTDGNVNTEIGVAQAVINQLKPDPEGTPQIFIVEMGAYRKGEIKLLCDIVKPRIGIVTGVNEQHLALFGSMKNLLSAEGGGELADALGKDGILIVNGGNKYCLDLYKKFDGKKKIYSLSNKVLDSDIWSDSITVKEDSISFIATNKTGELMHFDAKVLGGHNVQNLLGAILVARELGMNFDEISEACKNILPQQAGMTIKKEKHGINIIDSSYSSNPDGVAADLDYLDIFGANPTSLKLRGAKKVVVMPCIIELGEKSSEIHKKIGRKIAGICNMAIVTSRDEFSAIKKGAVEAGMKEKNIICAENPQDIYSLITLFCKSGDAVLLEGRVPNELVKLLV